MVIMKSEKSQIYVSRISSVPQNFISPLRQRFQSIRKPYTMANRPSVTQLCVKLYVKQYLALTERCHKMVFARQLSCSNYRYDTDIKELV